MLIFGSSDFGGDGRNWRVALDEAHAELAEVRRSLRSALDRERALRSRVELLESSRRAAFGLATWRR